MHSTIEGEQLELLRFLGIGEFFKSLAADRLAQF
jgi:hypothetical protein